MSVHTTSLSLEHTFSKVPQPHVQLIVNHGVESDCHAGTTVQHRSLMKLKPPRPNLRQVHLIPNEILIERGLKPGEVGENITTVDLDLLSLTRNTKLHFLPAFPSNTTTQSSSPHAIIRLTGLRNPCSQIEEFRAGLQEKFIVRNEQGKIVGRVAGVMGVVEEGGRVESGMRVVVEGAGEGEALKVV